jgi:hypothetical protein
MPTGAQATSSFQPTTAISHSASRLKRSLDDGGIDQLQPKRTRLDNPSRTASSMTPAYSPKHSTTNAGLDGQQGQMQILPWSTLGQQAQQQQRPQSPFNAPTAPWAAQNQQMQASSSPIQAWSPQYPQSPQQFMNGMWTAVLRPQRINQQPNPQPPFNTPKGPRG